MSGEEILFVRTRGSDSQDDITMEDVGVQTMTWQYYSLDELENEISFRASNDAFAMLRGQPVLLHADYNKRHQYKLLGATYNGETQRWSLLLGRELRRVLTLAPEWIDNAVMVQRRFLLRIVHELSQGEYFT